ncbi:hypothetical protein [Tardiphaga sp.]|jgi:hypothetical protein|uniref:hypothetical protein n=1 Tax=Tardiphaga sp. TaxID=1926292 RepID=UPI0037DA715F
MPYPFVPLFDSPIRVIDSAADAAARDPANGPPPFLRGRPKGSKRPHTDGKVAEVRRLMEDTTLTYRQIAARTGVGVGSIMRWKRDFGWQRHPFAARPTDTVPTARASRKLKLRMLGAKLHLLAERCVTELWNSPAVDLERLIGAMQVLQMARVEAMGRRRPRRSPFGPTRTVREWIDRDTAIRIALQEMRRGGVDIEHIPEEAMALLEDAHTPPEDHPALRQRGKRRRS